MKKGLLLLTIFLGSLMSQGQQTPVIEHYLQNQYFINPAAAGLNGNIAHLLVHRQWHGFSGAPETQVFTIDGNFNRDKMALGFTVINDQTNILGSTGGYFSYVYNVSITSKHKIRFGLSSGIVQNRLIFSNIIAEDESEMQLFNNQNATNFDAKAGIHYKFNELQLGFAISNLLSPKFRYENNFSSDSLSFLNIPHFNANAQYNFLLNGGKWSLMPSIYIKGAQGTPFIFESAISAEYNKKFRGTLKYHHNIGYSSMIGASINKQLLLGYSYGISSQEIGTQNSGSHEILIGYKIGKGSSEGVGSDANFRKLEEQNAELYEKTDALEQDNLLIKEELEKQKALLKERIYGLEELKKALEKERADREKMISEFEFKPNNSPSLENEDPKESEIIEEPEQSSPSPEDQNPKEPDVNEDSSDKIVEGDLYVVVGATREMKEAQNFQKILTREYELKTRIVRNSRASWFLIYTLETSDKKEANKELKRVKKVNTKDIYFGESWIYFEQ
tara:strand:- start:9050 stop:10561 length:1512 start_codon:yes stop_codon:yes gene_type:complete